MILPLTGGFAFELSSRRTVRYVDHPSSSNAAGVITTLKRAVFRINFYSFKRDNIFNDSLDMSSEHIIGAFLDNTLRFSSLVTRALAARIEGCLPWKDSISNIEKVALLRLLHQTNQTTHLSQKHPVFCNYWDRSFDMTLPADLAPTEALVANADFEDVGASLLLHDEIFEQQSNPKYGRGMNVSAIVERSFSLQGRFKPIFSGLMNQLDCELYRFSDPASYRPIVFDSYH